MHRYRRTRSVSLSKQWISYYCKAAQHTNMYMKRKLCTILEKKVEESMSTCADIKCINMYTKENKTFSVLITFVNFQLEEYSLLLCF